MEPSREVRPRPQAHEPPGDGDIATLLDTWDGICQIQDVGDFMVQAEPFCRSLVGPIEAGNRDATSAAIAVLAFALRSRAPDRGLPQIWVAVHLIHILDGVLHRVAQDPTPFRAVLGRHRTLAAQAEPPQAQEHQVDAAPPPPQASASASAQASAQAPTAGARPPTEAAADEGPCPQYSTLPRGSSRTERTASVVVSLRGDDRKATLDEELEVLQRPPAAAQKIAKAKTIADALGPLANAVDDPACTVALLLTTAHDHQMGPVELDCRIERAIAKTGRFQSKSRARLKALQAALTITQESRTWVLPRNSAGQAITVPGIQLRTVFITGPRRAVLIDRLKATIAICRLGDELTQPALAQRFWFACLRRASAVLEGSAYSAKKFLDTAVSVSQRALLAAGPRDAGSAGDPGLLRLRRHLDRVTTFIDLSGHRDAASTLDGAKALVARWPARALADMIASANLRAQILGGRDANLRQALKTAFGGHRIAVDRRLQQIQDELQVTLAAPLGAGAAAVGRRRVQRFEAACVEFVTAQLARDAGAKLNADLARLAEHALGRPVFELLWSARDIEAAAAAFGGTAAELRVDLERVAAFLRTYAGAAQPLAAALRRFEAPPPAYS